MDRRPTQDLAGVAGGGLEEDRDPNPFLERDRSVANDEPVVHDKGAKKPVGDLNDKPISSGDDDTRTITK